MKKLEIDNFNNGEVVDKDGNLFRVKELYAERVRENFLYTMSALLRGNAVDPRQQEYIDNSYEDIKNMLLNGRIYGIPLNEEKFNPEFYKILVVAAYYSGAMSGKEELKNYIEFLENKNNAK